MKTKNQFSVVAKNLSGISTLADHANNCGNINEEQRKELKEKTREAQLDNLFAAMAAYCQN